MDIKWLLEDESHFEGPPSGKHHSTTVHHAIQVEEVVLILWKWPRLYQNSLSAFRRRHRSFVVKNKKACQLVGELRNATSLIPQRLSYILLAITRSVNVRALPCIVSHWRIDRAYNTTPAVYVMHRSI